MGTSPTRICGVYFIQGVVTRLVKIGHSVDVASRLDALRCGSPDKLELLGILPGTVEFERSLHARFWSQTEHGEWFHGSPELFALAATGAELAATVGTRCHPRPRVVQARKYRLEPAPTAFAQRLREWRLSQGYSAHQTSKIVGDAFGSGVYAWETGQARPCLEVAVNIAQIWGLTMEEYIAIPGATRDGKMPRPRSETHRPRRTNFQIAEDRRRREQDDADAPAVTVDKAG